MYGISPKLPLLVDDIDGHYSLNKTLHDSIKQNFKNLILTSPGERLMDAEFGVGMRNYFFENFTPVLTGEIESNIIEQVNRYLSYVTIQDINITQAAHNPNLILVRIKYVIPRLATSDILILDLTTN